MDRVWTAAVAQQIQRFSDALFGLLEDDDTPEVDDEDYSDFEGFGVDEIEDSAKELILLAAWQFEQALPKHALHAQRFQVSSLPESLLSHARSKAGSSSTCSATEGHGLHAHAVYILSSWLDSISRAS